MRILFINQFFWPDAAATSQLLGDVVRGLAERGHEVTVICAETSDATGYATAGAGEGPPARIERVKAMPFGRGKVGRLVSYLSFYGGALVRAFQGPRQDVVVSLTTPPLIALVGALVKMVRGGRFFIWEMDMYPDVAVDLNYLKAGGLVERVTGLLADFARGRADGVLALGACMRERLAARGVDPAKISVAENWADGELIVPREREGKAEELVLLYSGNLGLAHDLATLLGAIQELREDRRFRFVFAGGGGGRAELEAFCAREAIGSVELRPYVALAELGASLSVGDIGVVTQRDVSLGAVVPSKVYGILAAGRPLLFIGPRTATPALTVAEYACGWQIDCGDVAGLVRLLRRLVEQPEEIRAAGVRAREALLARFDRPLGVGRIAAILEGDDAGVSQVRFAPGEMTPVGGGVE